MFQLVDLSSWKYKELEQAGIEVKRTFGLEIPNFKQTDTWWLPQESAIALNLSLDSLKCELVNFTAPGPYLLPSTPFKYTRRHVKTLTVSDSLKSPTAGWWKAAEAKIDKFDSRWRTADELVRDIEKAQLPSSSLLQVSSQRLPILREYRSFVLDGSVTTTSIYLETFKDGTCLSVYDGLQTNVEELEAVVCFTQELVRNMSLPRGLTVDVAVLQDGLMAVLEYNPAWCSGWYDCDLKQVEATIQASLNDFNPTWAYTPDSYMLKKISKRAPLPLDMSTFDISKPVF
jgi:hypothetical protein